MNMGHLGHVLVVEGEAVGLRRGEPATGVRLVAFDQLLAAARITGDRGGRDRQRSGHQPRIHQRAQQKNEPGGMAAGIRDALGAPELLALPGGEFGQVERPVGRHAMRGAGVDQARLGVGHPARGFTRCGVGQAEKRDVRRVEQPRALGFVLAPVGVDAKHFDVVALGKILMDAQPGGAFLAIDEHAVLHRFTPVKASA
jgi:hypothetical protein